MPHRSQTHRLASTATEVLPSRPLSYHVVCLFIISICWGYRFRKAKHNSNFAGPIPVLYVRFPLSPWSLLITASWPLILYQFQLTLCSECTMASIDNSCFISKTSFIIGHITWSSFSLWAPAYKRWCVLPKIIVGRANNISGEGKYQVLSKSCRENNTKRLQCRKTIWNQVTTKRPGWTPQISSKRLVLP